jgi:hypothetical protein
MPFGRSKKDKNGVFRHVCLNLACDKRVDKERKKSNIIDRNYCAWHQDINHYFNDDLERIKEPPKNFFSNPDNVKRMIEKIFKKENIETNKEIYDCNRSVFRNYMSSIYQHVDNVAEGIITLFPEKNLKWYYFNPIPSGILDIEASRRELFDAFLSDNNIDINSDNIYNIELKLLESHKACTLINYYKHSIYDIIKNLYPNRELIPWYFKGLNNYFINQDNSFNIDNIKKWFMYEIYTKYNFSEELSEYDKIHNILLTINGDLLLKTRGGSFISNHLSGSLYKFIYKIYPEYNIKPWDLTRLPANYFNNEEDNDEKYNKQKLQEFIEYIAHEECLIIPDDYKKLTITIINKYSSRCVEIARDLQNNSIGNSVICLLKYIYPEFNLINDNSITLNETIRYIVPLEFYNPKNEEGKKNLKLLLDNHLINLQYITLESHYKLRYDDFKGYRLANIIKKYYKGIYIYLIIDIYPENKYDIIKFRCNKFNQILYACINNLCIEYKFDNKNIEYEKSYPDLYDINLLRFDACLNITINNKDYCINFEKDGLQHFEAVDLFGGEEKFVIQRNHDVKKNNYINSNDNLYLIRISYKECRNNYLFNKVLNELFEDLYTNIKLNKNITKKIYVSNIKLYEYLF